MSVIGLDCETHLIRPGLLAPPMVCTSFAARDDDGIGGWLETPTEGGLEATLEWFLSTETLVGANVAYDIAVIMARYPGLVPSVFEAYAEGRILDVQEIQKLTDTARGRLGGYHTGHAFVRHSYSLAELVKRHLGEDRTAEKMDPNGWRLRYSELEDVPLTQWPEDASRYALDDATDALSVYEAQCKERNLWESNIAARCRSAFSLHLMSVHGIMTHEEGIRALEAMTVGRFRELTGVLNASGLVRDDGSRATKKAKARMISVCRELGIDWALTKTGRDRQKAGEEIDREKYVALDEDACEACGDDLLEAYAERTRLATIVETSIPKLRKGLFTPIQARFDFAETGRTTCSEGRGATNGYQLQNMPAHGKEGRVVYPVRQCFRARPGFVFIDADFSGLELCTVAQACKILVGFSQLGEALNAGIDVHLDLGAQLLGIPYAEARERKHEKAVKEARQLAKVANFGFPGGLGFASFVTYARKKAGLRIHVDDARALKDTWLNRWPEFRLYFDYVKRLCDAHGVAQVVQLGSGRIRGMTAYTEACNGFFQGLGADGALEALWEVTRACYADPESSLYGSRPVNFVHDQIITETPVATAHEAAAEMGRIMIEACNRYLPDYPVKCEPCLSHTWEKGAEAVFVEGRLVPWDWARDNRIDCVYSDGKRVAW